MTSFADFIDGIKSMANERLLENHRNEFYRRGFTILAQVDGKAQKKVQLKTLWNELINASEAIRRAYK